jgi:hypothetical protein
MRRRRSSSYPLSWFALSASAPGSAAGFGTIEGGGQNREHERITRAALACAGDGGSEADCFEPRSMDLVAVHAREFGAVGTPDKDELALRAAHCDDIDFLAGEYPRTRGQARDALLNCVDQLRGRFGQGADSAPALLDDQGQIVPDQVTLDPECRFGEATSREAADSRAKCVALEGLGRVLHGARLLRTQRLGPI